MRCGLVVLVACAIVAGYWLASTNLRVGSLEENSSSVREAVLSSARQCCAIEGTYPSSIEYLEEHYGLSVNHKDYLITYEAFSSNILPEVTVTVR